MLLRLLLVSLLAVALAGSPDGFIFFVHDSNCNEPRSMKEYHDEVLQHLDLPTLEDDEEFDDIWSIAQDSLNDLLAGGVSSPFFSLLANITGLPAGTQDQIKQMQKDGSLILMLKGVANNTDLVKQTYQIGSKVVSGKKSGSTRRLRKLSPQNDLKLPLNELDPESRRDVVMFMLERLIQHHTNAKRGKVKAGSITVGHFADFHLDIVDGSRFLSKMSLLGLMKHLPCALFPPEANFERHISATPNDEYYAQQWHLHKDDYGANVAGAWECSQGEKTGALVGHFDTGCAPHPDLEPNLCKCNEACASYDATAGDNPFIDKNGHGTMVASVFAAKSNNGYRHAGISGESEVMCIKVDDNQGKIYFSAIVGGFAYTLEKKVKVLNLSLTGFGRSKTEAHVFKRLEEENVLVITAAGNFGDSKRNLGCDIDAVDNVKACQNSGGKKLDGPFPAAYGFENVIVVAASNKEGKAWTGSNYGSKSVDLFAPGVAINVLHPSSTLDAVPFTVQNGTSFSAAMVTGMVLELLRHDPTLTPLEARDFIIQNTRTVEHLTGLCNTGGILDGYSAMVALSKRKACKKSSFNVSPTPTPETIKTYEGSQCFTKPTQRYLPRYNCEVDENDWCSPAGGRAGSAGRTAGIALGVVGALGLLVGGGWYLKSRMKQDGSSNTDEVDGETTVHVVLMDEEKIARSAGVKGKVVGLPARR